MNLIRKSTNIITLILALSGVVFIWLASIIKDKGAGSEVEYYIELLFVVFGFFIWGCTGIFIMIRQEAPQMIPVRGKSAIIIGLILVIFSWSMAFYGFYLAILRLLS